MKLTFRRIKLTKPWVFLVSTIIDNLMSSFFKKIESRVIVVMGVEVYVLFFRVLVTICVLGFKLGLPLIPIHPSPNTKGENLLKGVNYAFGALGIENYSRRTFVSANRPLKLYILCGFKAFQIVQTL